MKEKTKKILSGIGIILFILANIFAFSPFPQNNIDVSCLQPKLNNIDMSDVIDCTKWERQLDVFDITTASGAIVRSF